MVISWKGFDLLRTCIASLRAQTLTMAEVVVVDNGSTDGSLEWLREQAGIRLIENGANRGFAAANNQGISATTSDLVLLVNADVDLAPDYVERCAAHFAHPDVGSVTGKLLRANPTGMIDSTGHNFFRNGWGENRGEETPDVGYDVADEVFGVCAAAALYRRDALMEAAVDGQVLDEAFFAYIEDLDLDWRLRWLGWRAEYEPAAVAVHHRSATGARMSSTVMRHILKNRLLLVAKNYEPGMLARNGIGVAAFALVKAVDFGRMHPSAVLGLVDFFRLLPHAKHWRSAIMHRRRVDAARMTPWMRPFPWLERVRRRAS